MKQITLNELFTLESMLRHSQDRYGNFALYESKIDVLEDNEKEKHLIIYKDEKNYIKLIIDKKENYYTEISCRNGIEHHTAWAGLYFLSSREPDTSQVLTI